MTMFDKIIEIYKAEHKKSTNEIILALCEQCGIPKNSTKATIESCLMSIFDENELLTTDNVKIWDHADHGLVEIHSIETIALLFGKRHLLRRTVRLTINNRVEATHESVSDDQLNKIVSRMKDLVSNRDPSVNDKLESVFNIFPKDIDFMNVIGAFDYAFKCFQSVTNINDFTDEYWELQNVAVTMICRKYIEYLNSKADTDPQYIKNMANWIYANAQKMANNEDDEIKSPQLTHENHEVYKMELFNSFCNESPVYNAKVSNYVSDFFMAKYLLWHSKKD